MGSNVRYVRASPALYHWAMVVMTQSQGKPDYILSAGLGSGIPPSDWLAESRPLIGSLEVSPRPGGIFMRLAKNVFDERKHWLRRTSPQLNPQLTYQDHYAHLPDFMNFC